MSVVFPKAAQTQTFSLSGSGITAGSTSLVLKTFTKIDGTLLAMSDFGAIGYGTLEPGNNTQEESISFTGVTQNLSNGTCTLTGVSSVGFTTPYALTTGVTKTHAGATTFVISNTSGFYDNINHYIDQIAVSGGVPATTTTLGLTKMSYAPADPANPIALGQNDPVLNTLGIKKFGGTGADGALNGTTVIDLASAQVVVKNYLSISLTGTSTLTFINPHANGTTIILKSQGNVTITSSAAAAIDASGMGAAGGSATAFGLTLNGGRGGSGLYIECAGALNFTGIIKNNGTNASSSGSSLQPTGITRGGPKGSTLILYNTLTANSGTSQTNDGSDLGGQGGSIGPTTAANGNNANGIYNLAYGGQGGGLTKTPNGTLFFPWVVSSYSKITQILPSSGSGTGQMGDINNGTIGIGGSVNLIAANTEFS